MGSKVWELESHHEVPHIFHVLAFIFPIISSHTSCHTVPKNLSRFFPVSDFSTYPISAKIVSNSDEFHSSDFSEDSFYFNVASSFVSFMNLICLGLEVDLRPLDLERHPKVAQFIE